MKKSIAVLLLCATLFLSSGFGTVSNDTLEQSEVITQEIAEAEEVEKQKESQTLVTAVVEEQIEEEQAQSIAEKLGEYLVATVHYVVKGITSFLLSLLQ